MHLNARRILHVAKFCSRFRSQKFLSVFSLFILATLCLIFVLFLNRQTDASAHASSASIESPQVLQNSLQASVSTKVIVPASMRSAPFDVDRYLNVPANFAASVYTRVAGARFIAVAPNGDLLVSRPGSGDVRLVRPNSAGGDPVVSTFVSGLRNPHDIVFHTIGAVTYVYISESHQINRFVYTFGAATAGAREIVVANLPDSSSPELQGAYGHQLKNIALDSNNKLYVAIASATNASPSDTTSNPVRCAVYQYNADGTNGRLFARGLRNAEGLAILPGSTELWVVVNNRDNIAYPFHNDWDGDGTDDYGKVMPSYVDNHPPEEFTRVRDGGNYGWPFANPNPDTAAGLNDMPFDLDVQNNANGQWGPPESFDRITKGIQAHSAPLGISFLQNSNFVESYRNGAAVAYHGSWNRTRRVGYKIAYFPWDAARNALGDEINLVTGWVNDATQEVWGRPVDVIADLNGNLLISDDQSGTIYKLSSSPTPIVPAAPSNLSGTAVSRGQIDLRWTDNSSDESGFKIEQSTDNVNYSEINTVGANNTNYSSVNLIRNKVYYFRVRAYNAAGFSAYSNTVAVKTLKR